MLRRFLKALAIGAALVSTSATAAVPLQMNVQGSLLNADGSPVSGTYSIVFTLYDGAAANASPVWSETIADVAASSGVFDEVLGGAGTPLAASVFTGTNQLWLGIRILSGPGVPNGGQAELPRRPLATVAYAFESYHAVSATTADNLTCDKCVSLTELGFDVATQSELDDAINTVKALPAAVSLDLQCNGCVSTTELGFDVATQSELDSVSTALNSALGTLNTTVSGLSSTLTALSGTVSSLGTTVAGHTTSIGQLGTDLTALTNRVTTAETNITALKAEVTLSDLACTAGQIPMAGANGTWACATPPQSTPSAACTGEYKALQWDGTQWKCVTVTNTGLSTGNAKGFEARDSWGAVFDGVERQAATWQQARDYCVSKGGRLPTASELYRVSASQFSELGTTYETNWLWTLTPWNTVSNPRQYTLVRLDQTNKVNTVSYANDTNLYAYRCIWPNNTTKLFTSNNCYGPAGSECFQSSDEGKRFNFDKYDRPSLPYPSAVWECEFYGAHVPTTLQMSEAITGGLPNGTNEWNWTSDYTRYDLNDVVRWTGANPSGWNAYYSTYLSWDGRAPNNRQFFRCMGLNYAPGENPNPTPADTITWGPKWVGASTKLVSHEKQLGAKTYHEASDDCWERGGHIPHTRDWAELITAGLPNGPGVSADSHWTWASDWTYQTYPEIIRWLGTDTYYPATHSTYATWSGANTQTRPYRCTWYPIDESYQGPAGGLCNNGQLPCYATSYGGTVKTKVWADPFDRPNNSWINAVKDCADEGGHLMGTRDYVELIRDGLKNGTAPNWYWTADSVGNTDTNPGLVILLRWNAEPKKTWIPTANQIVGANTYSTYTWDYRQSGNNYTYRCMWTNQLW